MPRPLLILLVLWGAELRGEILLKGIIEVSGVPMFSLYSTEDQTSKWVSLGQAFANTTAVEFDRSRGVLTTVQGARRVQLRLVETPIPVAQTSSETPPDFVVRITNAGVLVGGNVVSIGQLGSVAAGHDKKATVKIAQDEDLKPEVGSRLEPVTKALADLGFRRFQLVKNPPASKSE